MIKKLSVSNYALIDRLGIEPSPGLSIITGETGAGKSILLGALGLATGARADLSTLREADRKCVVELTIDVAEMGLEGFFSDNDLDFEPQTILRREILPGGKSRAFVNDTPVLLDALSALSARLVDIHSQHQSLLLSKPEYRIAIVDGYAGDTVLLTQYRESFATHRKFSARQAELSSRQAELSRTQDYNRYLLEELDKAALSDENEQEELENLCTRLSNSQQIKADLFSLSDLLDAEERGVLPRLSQAVTLLHRVEKYLPPRDETAARAQSTLIELKDISAQVSSLLSDTDDDPTLLERSTARLDTIYSLQRKHHAADIAALIALRESLRGEVAGLDCVESEMEAVAKELSLADAQMRQAARELTQARNRAARELSDEITATVRTLGMPNAEFLADVKPSGSFTGSGADDVNFLFSANLGGSPAQVEKVASGGELSRIMLAIKYSLARKSQLPCVVFDEIDSGVSGDIADRMGRIMLEMSRHMQVIAITHLPQIASRGDMHYKVLKQEKDGTTVSRVALLNQDERIAELAQMISGSNVTASATEHARELLKQNGHS